MGSLKKIQVEPLKIEKLNEVISQKITNEIRQDEFYYALEGVVATGIEFGSVPGYGCQLLFIMIKFA